LHREEVSPHEPRPCTADIDSLALVEMKTLLRDIYGTFTTTVAKEMTGDMSIDDQIIASRPKDQTCLLVFTERVDVSS
jgi:hypothetical protein